MSSFQPPRWRSFSVRLDGGSRRTGRGGWQLPEKQSGSPHFLHTFFPFFEFTNWVAGWAVGSVPTVIADGEVDAFPLLGWSVSWVLGYFPDRYVDSIKHWNENYGATEQTIRWRLVFLVGYQIRRFEQDFMGRIPTERYGRRKDTPFRAGLHGATPLKGPGRPYWLCANSAVDSWWSTAQNTRWPA